MKWKYSEKAWAGPDVNLWMDAHHLLDRVSKATHMTCSTLDQLKFTAHTSDRIWFKNSGQLVPLNGLNKVQIKYSKMRTLEKSSKCSMLTLPSDQKTVSLWEWWSGYNIGTRWFRAVWLWHMGLMRAICDGGLKMWSAAISFWTGLAAAAPLSRPHLSRSTCVSENEAPPTSCAFTWPL